MRCLALLPLALILVAPALAQGPAPLSFLPPDAPIAPSPGAVEVPEAQGRSPVTLAFGGLTGGVAGFMVGALIGAEAASDCGGEGLCQLAGAVLGGIAGQAVGIPVGVHLSNGGRGRLGSAVGASVGIGLASILLLSDLDAPALLLVTPALQIAASVGLERGSSRRR